MIIFGLNKILSVSRQIKRFVGNHLYGIASIVITIEAIINRGFMEGWKKPWYIQNRTTHSGTLSHTRKLKKNMLINCHKTLGGLLNEI